MKPTDTANLNAQVPSGRTAGLRPRFMHRDVLMRALETILNNGLRPSISSVARAAGVSSRSLHSNHPEIAERIHMLASLHTRQMRSEGESEARR